MPKCHIVGNLMHWLICLIQKPPFELGLVHNQWKNFTVFKRNDFNFEIVNAPFLDCDVPRSPSWGIHISIAKIRWEHVGSRWKCGRRYTNIAPTLNIGTSTDVNKLK